jgi:NAD(P)H-hydrate epimerase
MRDLLQKIYPKRNPWTHKGLHGYVLIVAGSKRYSGSPIFNALSALRAGADLTTIVGPKRAMDIAASFLPDLICYPLDGDYLEEKHLVEILTISRGFNSLVIGGGLTRNKKTLRAIQRIIQKINLPMVVDADAIYAVAKNPKVLKNKMAVLTPQIKEFEVLTGERVYSNVLVRKQKVKKWAKKLATVILLKGYVDIISDGRRVFLNKTGSPFMTKGGFGDTLAGICGALLARNISPFEGACLAAYINGKAGELAARKYGEGVLASDIFEFIPRVINKN